MIDEAFGALVPVVGVKPACELVGVSKASYYRRAKPPVYGPPRPRPTPPNALSDVERGRVLSELHRPEHADLAVAQVWARLLDGVSGATSGEDGGDTFGEDVIGCG